MVKRQHDVGVSQAGVARWFGGQAFAGLHEYSRSQQFRLCGLSTTPLNVFFRLGGKISYYLSMTDFKLQIARHRDTLNELHERIHATFKVRDRSEGHKRAWSEACSAFHSFSSEVDNLMDKVSHTTVAEDEQTRTFVFDFLSIDPVYFRSGYQKERLLKLVKVLHLTEHEKAVLRQTIQCRVRSGALREFRRFCQLIPKIQSDDFILDLKTGARSTDEAIRRRAAFALEYIVA